MADNELAAILRLWHWRIPDPGPAWLIESVDNETRAKLALNALQLEKDVMTARSAAIDRQIQVLKGAARG